MATTSIMAVVQQLVASMNTLHGRLDAAEQLSRQSSGNKLEAALEEVRQDVWKLMQEVKALKAAQVRERSLLEASIYTRLEQSLTRLVRDRCNTMSQDLLARLGSSGI